MLSANHSDDTFFGLTSFQADWVILLFLINLSEMGSRQVYQSNKVGPKV